MKTNKASHVTELNVGHCVWERVVSKYYPILLARVKGGRDKRGARARKGREHTRGATHQH